MHRIQLHLILASTVWLTLIPQVPAEDLSVSIKAILDSQNRTMRDAQQVFDRRIELTTRQSVSRLNELAEQAFRQSDVAGAIQAWRTTLVLDPDNFEARKQLKALNADEPEGVQTMTFPKDQHGTATQKEMELGLANFAGKSWSHEIDGKRFTRTFSRTGTCQLHCDGQLQWEFPVEYLSPSTVLVINPAGSIDNVHVLSGGNLLFVDQDPVKRFQIPYILKPVDKKP